jgi:hypothetical protein
MFSDCSQYLGIQLFENVGFQAKQSLVARDGGQHFGGEDGAAVFIDLVVQPVGVDDSLPFAEDDVSLEIDFPPARSAAAGIGSAAERCQGIGPGNHPIGFDQRHAGRQNGNVTGLRQPFNSADDDAHATRDGEDRFVRSRTGIGLSLSALAAARIDVDLSRRRCAHDRRRIRQRLGGREWNGQGFGWETGLRQRLWLGLGKLDRLQFIPRVPPECLDAPRVHRRPLTQIGHRLDRFDLDRTCGVEAAQPRLAEVHFR